MGWDEIEGNIFFIAMGMFFGFIKLYLDRNPYDSFSKSHRFATYIIISVGFINLFLLGIKAVKHYFF